MFPETNNPNTFAVSSSEPSTPTYKLYDSNAVAVATFLGGPIPGTALMALNYRRLGQIDRAVFAILAGLSTILAGILFTNLFPAGSAIVFGIAISTATWRTAEKLQSAVVDEHVNRGGPLGSNWVAGGLGGTFLLILGSIIFLPQILSPKVTVGHMDIYYSQSATREDAQSFGDALTKIGFTPATQASIYLAKGKNDGTVVSFVLQEGFWDRPGVLWSFENIVRNTAPAIGGLPVKVRLINDKKESQKEFVVGQVAFDKDNIYYLGTATEAEASAFGQSLKSAGYFLGKGFDVFLDKEKDGTTVSFVATSGWNEPAQIASYNAIIRDAAPTIGGLPVQLRVVDTNLEVKKEVAVQ